MKNGLFIRIIHTVDVIALSAWLLFNGERMWHDIQSHYDSIISEGEGYMEEFVVKTATVDDKIYWIKSSATERALMVADIIDGEPDHSTARPFVADEDVPDGELMWVFDMLDQLKD